MERCNMLKKTIVDAITGEETILDLTAEEIAEVEKERLEIEIKIQNEISKAEARKSVLEKLGLTEDEAKLLLS